VKPQLRSSKNHRLKGMNTPNYEDCPKCGLPMCEQQYPRQEVCRCHEKEEEEETEEETEEESAGEAPGAQS